MARPIIHWLCKKTKTCWLIALLILIIGSLFFGLCFGAGANIILFAFTTSSLKAAELPGRPIHQSAITDVDYFLSKYFTFFPF